MSPDPLDRGEHLNCFAQRHGGVLGFCFLLVDFKCRLWYCVMPNPVSDQNLLFAVLALQNDLVAKEDLLAGQVGHAGIR